MEPLLSRIQDRTAVVGVIGQGYVGLPARAGLLRGRLPRRSASTSTQPRSTALARGESYIKHIGPERGPRRSTSGRFSATTDFDRLAECDAIIICVPTPLGQHREPDNSYIHATAEQIAKRLRPGQLVVLESTTYPGTTDDEVLPILASGPGSAAARTSCSRSRRSARTRATRRTSTPGPSPRSSAA